MEACRFSIILACRACGTVKAGMEMSEGDRGTDDGGDTFVGHAGNAGVETRDGNPSVAVVVEPSPKDAATEAATEAKEHEDDSEA
mmetsp:Transcript_45803/g.139143  ORF Transcript_45803/g.139143 Transcript_45803/m.139143 type:complete len:85 (-) Transcript_45803:472-726(-)